jgi:hypothetical protein
MNIEETKKIVLENIELSEKVNLNFNNVDSIITFSIQVFEIADNLMNAIATYLNTPDDGGRNAPLQAWKGTNPDKVATHKAFKDFMELMDESNQLMKEMTEFRHKFDLFITEYSDHLEY